MPFSIFYCLVYLVTLRFLKILFSGGGNEKVLSNMLHMESTFIYNSYASRLSLGSQVSIGTKHKQSKSNNSTHPGELIRKLFLFKEK